MSSHSNPLFSSAPGGDLDASVDIQSAALPTVHEVPSEAAELLEPSQRYAIDIIYAYTKACIVTQH